MDNRRLTISSEEQIGEALMRVSNTLEAQRLTKSLEYQEKIRRRTAFRMVLSIILFCILLLLLIVGGLLLYVLWKYMDPILQRLLPFLEMVFKDFGTIWRSLVESSTYMPAFLDRSLKMMDELLITMQEMHGLPLKEMLYNINNILATTNGMLAGMGNAMAGAGDALAGMGADMSGFMSNMRADIKPILDQVPPIMESMHDGMGVLAETIENMKLPGGTIDRLGNITDQSLTLVETVMKNTDPDQLGDIIKGSMNSMEQTIGTINTLNEAIAENSNGIDAIIKSLSDGLASFASAMGKLDKLGILNR